MPMRAGGDAGNRRQWLQRTPGNMDAMRKFGRMALVLVLLVAGATMLAADELFLSSTMQEILPVVRVNGRRIGTGHFMAAAGLSE